MSRLGDLLELLHGARQRWTTVELTAKNWVDLEVARRASERHIEEARARGDGASLIRVGTDQPGESLRTYESVSRMWLQPVPERFRVERSDPHGDSTYVQVGDQWWSYHPTWGATSNEGTSTRHGGSDEIAVLLDPALVLGLVDFEVRGTEEQDGCSVLVVRATPRDLSDRARMGHYLEEADEFRLRVDAERGVILRLESRFDGEPHRVHELTRVMFDAPMPEETFVFRPPEGEPIRSTAELMAPPRAVSLEEAVRQAPFTVLAPERLPEGWRLQVRYFPGRDRPPWPPAVVLSIEDPTGVHNISVTERAEADDDSLPWQEVEFEGDRYLVYESGALGNRDVKLVREGTHVRLTGDVERDALLGIAHALRPGPTDLPPMVDRP